jgi:hypothetical protein
VEVVAAVAVAVVAAAVAATAADAAAITTGTGGRVKVVRMMRSGMRVVVVGVVVMVGHPMLGAAY